MYTMDNGLYTYGITPSHFGYFVFESITIIIRGHPTRKKKTVTPASKKNSN